MKKPAVQIIAIVIGVVVAFAALNALKGCETSPTSQRPVIIGQITEVAGQVERRKAGTAAMETVPNPRPFGHQDLLVTQKASSAVLQLEPEGPSLRLNENSRLVVERDTSHPGAFIGTLLDGTVTILNPGKAGSFRLFQEGREISPESAERKSVPVLPSGDMAGNPSSGSAKAGASPAAGTAPALMTITAVNRPEEIATPTPFPASFDTPDGEAPTNEEIIRTLRSQTGLFQRCYLSFIHRAGPLGGKGQTGIVTLTFTIQPSGKITGAKPVRSDFGDTTLHNCVTEVVERARFKAFRGDAVPIGEFPIALQ